MTIAPGQLATAQSVNAGLAARLLLSANLADVPNKGAARGNLGLGGMATQNPSSVQITGGTITGVPLGTVQDPLYGAFGQIDLVGNLTAPPTGEFWSNDGARVQRINDRLLVGAATENDAAKPANAIDWLTALVNWPVFNATAAILSAVGTIALTVGSQTADLNPAAAGSTQTTIGVASFAMANNAGSYPGDYYAAYGFYGEGRVYPGSVSDAFAAELEAINLTGTPNGTPTPYRELVVGSAQALRLGSGGGQGLNPQPAISALAIVPNGSTFNAGIVFEKGALTGADGTTGFGQAVQMGLGHMLTWWRDNGGTGEQVAAITSTISASGKVVSLQAQDGGWVFVQPSGAAGFTIETVASAANYLIARPAISAGTATLAVGSPNSNADLALLPKGTGTVTAPSLAVGATNTEFVATSAGAVTAKGTTTLASASAAYLRVTGGATAATGGTVSITTVGTDTNTHLTLTTKNATSYVFTNRPFLQTTHSTLATMVGLMSPYRSFYTANNYSYAGAMAARFGVEGAISGTITGSAFAINQFTVSSDNVDASSAGGLTGLYTSISCGGSNFNGNRTGGTFLVNNNTDSPNQAPFSFLTGISGRATTRAITGAANGFGYAETDGYVFGGLLSASAGAGARFVRQVVGLELNPTVADEDVPVFERHGIQMVLENTENGYVMRGNAAFGLTNQTGYSGEGWDYAYAFNLNNGKFGVRSGWGTILGGPDSQYTANPTTGFGVDFVGLTLTQAAFRGPAANSIIDGSGNIGGQIVAGTTLQTRSEVRAQTAVVNTITVIEGSLILTKPTLTVAAPPGSGTQATAAVDTMGAALFKAISGTPTGYAVNDTVTLSGGTFTSAAVLTVLEVDIDGAPTLLKVTTPGSYTVLPSAPIDTTTSGSGSGLTLTMWWTILTVTVTGAGSNYPLYPPPNVTAAAVQTGSDVSPLRRPYFQVSMTATRVPLQLNAGKINVAGIPTSASGLATGDLWNDGGTLKVAA